MTYTSGMQVEILLPRPFDHGFDYLVPEGLGLENGDYVSVPFGRQTLVGVVWGPGRGAFDPAKCKPVTALHGHLPPMPEPMRQFIDWSAAYYLNPKGMLLKMAIPMAKAIMKPEVEAVYRLGQGEVKLTAVRQKIIDSFCVGGNAPSPLGRGRGEGVLQQSKTEKSTQVASPHPNPLPKGEGTTAAELIIHRDALLKIASPSVIRAMVKAGQLMEHAQPIAHTTQSFSIRPAPTLRPEQAEAVERIHPKLESGFSVTVLDGVTGSGKTEVYFDAIERLLANPENQVLVLLPEIALTTQWLARCEARFGTGPILWHSGLTEAQRRKNWQAITGGSARLIVGARSALYLPYANLRLIIVDEEHETSYKQDDGVPYQARDMAVARAHREQFPVLLVSATPSLETISNIRRGKYSEVKLADQHGRHGFAKISLIDLRQDKPERQCWLSPSLRQAMNDTLAEGHQSMLFLNRRGYAPLVLCRHCGYRFQCPHCSAWLVQHVRPLRLECHHCGHRQPQPPACPACGVEDQLAACGPGVDRLEEEVRRLWPQARVVTLTSDDTKLGDAINLILERQTDIIIGTQLVAKGHHFPHLALVGVVDADLGLSGGDLRACEHTFQLLHQLAGRAGREDIAGKVLLQTCQPQHPVLQAMARGDRDGFVELEMKQREDANWPPFGRLAALLLDGEKEQEVATLARQIVRNAPSVPGVRILGPAPAPLSRLKDQYRYRILVKATRETPLQAYLQDWLGGQTVPRSIRLKVDIDPYYFL